MARESVYETSDTVRSELVARSAVVESLRRIVWGAVIAGVVMSLITHLLLSMLGIGIGVSTIEPMRGDTPAAETLSLSAGIWWSVSGIIAALVGGWVAGRLSGTPFPASAALHGLVTWATTTLIVLYLVTTAVGSLISGTFSVLGQVASGAGEMVKAVAPQVGDAAQGPLSELRREIEGMMRGGGAGAPSGEEVRSVVQAVTGTNVSQADRDEAARIVAQRAGISEDEARNRLNQWSETYQRNLAQAEERARAAAEATASVMSRAAIYGFVALILGAIAGAIGGRAGRSREEVTVATTR